jgi:hypothetical protein
VSTHFGKQRNLVNEARTAVANTQIVLFLLPSIAPLPLKSTACPKSTQPALQDEELLKTIQVIPPLSLRTPTSPTRLTGRALFNSLAI